VRKVMILDDNILDVMNTERYLRGAGYQVIKMSTPSGALAKLEYENPEILLLDITMNRLNVQGFLQSLQGEGHHDDLIVVILSDLDAETLQKYCMENDIHGYYCKSMDITKLPEFLDNFYEDDEEDTF
jgi:DNA-binding NarL/FixJ family response regulator